MAIEQSVSDVIDAPEARRDEEAPAGLRAARHPWEKWDPFVLYGTFLICTTSTFAYSSDDPFITLRYAANIVHGHGAVFNIGGERVEGFSSPLHLALAVVMYVIPGSHALLKMKLLSFVFAVLTLVASRKLVRAASLRPWAQTATLFLIGSSWALAVSASNGLETTLACWLTTLLVAGLVTGEGTSRPVFMGLCAAGLVAARPEGIAVTFVLALCALVGEIRTTPWWRRCSWFLGALASAVLIELGRIAYYGQLLPNTYFAKRGALSTDIRRGTDYVVHMLPGIPGLIRLEILVIILIGSLVIAWSPNRRHLYVLAAVAAQVLFAIEVGGDWMVGDRFITPIVPMAAVLVMTGVAWIVEFSRRRLPSGLRWLHVGVCITLGVTLCAIVVTPYAKANDPLWNSRWRFDDASLVSAGGYGTLSRLYWPTGLSMLRCTPSGSLVAYSEDGYAGFERLDLRFLDTRGLTDSIIAHNAPANEKSSIGVTEFGWTSPRSVVGSQILRQRPALILTFDFAYIPTPSRVFNGAYSVKDSALYFFTPSQFMPVIAYERNVPKTGWSDLHCGGVPAVEQP